MPNAGKENLLVDISNIQCKKNDVHIWIINNYYDEKLLEKFNKKINVIKFNRKINSKSLFPFLRMNLHLLKLKPDVVHTHDAYIIKIFPFIPKSRFVTTIHNTRLFENCLFAYKKIFVISEAVRNDLYTCGLAKISEKVVTIYNGIEFPYIKKKNNFIINNPLMIIQVGRLKMDQKGQDLSIKALSVLKKVGISFHFDIVGTGPDLTLLKDLVHKYQLENEISFLGEKE